MLKTRDLGWNRIKREIIALDKMSVYVGIQGSNALKHSGDATLVEIATYNHFGTEKIPSRPFLTHAITANKSQIMRRISASVRVITSGAAKTEKQLALIGEYVVSLTQDEITAWADPPNAPATVKRKGFNNPLVWTGTLRRSVTYEVRP